MKLVTTGPNREAMQADLDRRRSGAAVRYSPNRARRQGSRSSAKKAAIKAYSVTSDAALIVFVICVVGLVIVFSAMMIGELLRELIAQVKIIVKQLAVTDTRVEILTHQGGDDE